MRWTKKIYVVVLVMGDRLDSNVIKNGIELLFWVLSYEEEEIGIMLLGAWWL